MNIFEKHNPTMTSNLIPGFNEIFNNWLRLFIFGIAYRIVFNHNPIAFEKQNIMQQINLKGL